MKLIFLIIVLVCFVGCFGEEGNVIYDKAEKELNAIHYKMYVYSGNCPECGAPIYAEKYYTGTPRIKRTCECMTIEKEK